MGLPSGCWGRGRPFTGYLEGEEGSARQLEEEPLTQPCSVSPRADSVAWNPHKLLGAGLQCSALLLRDTSVGLPSPQTPALLSFPISPWRSLS